MHSEPQGHATRELIEADLRELRRQLADAWWYEKPLEKIQELEGLISVRTQELGELA